MALAEYVTGIRYALYASRVRYIAHLVQLCPLAMNSLHVLDVHERIVDRNHRGLGVLVHRTEHHASDAPKPVDSYADRHDVACEV